MALTLGELEHKKKELMEQIESLTIQLEAVKKLIKIQHFDVDDLESEILD